MGQAEKGTTHMSDNSDADKLAYRLGAVFKVTDRTTELIEKELEPELLAEYRKETDPDLMSPALLKRYRELEQKAIQQVAQEEADRLRQLAE